jgi:hypothetical protein
MPSLDFRRVIRLFKKTAAISWSPLSAWCAARRDVKRVDRVKGDRAAKPGDRRAMDEEPVQRTGITAGIGLEKGRQLIHELALGHLIRTAPSSRRQQNLRRPGLRQPGGLAGDHDATALRSIRHARLYKLTIY